MIVITGATGQLGGLIVEGLLGRLPADQICVTARHPTAARGFAHRGVPVRRGDFADAGSLVAAFEGATQVLLVSAGGTGASTVDLHRNAIDAAVAAGAERILYTSHMGAQPTSPFHPMQDHSATEAILGACGVPFTSLRNGFYSSTVAMLLGAATQTGRLAVPDDGPIAWTTHADLADAAVTALVDGGLDGITPALTASDSVDMTGVAAIASELCGRPIERVTVSDADYRAGFAARGAPDAAAEMMIGMFGASRRGDFAVTDPTLENLLGRRPTSLRDVLRPIIIRSP